MKLIGALILAANLLEAQPQPLIRGEISPKSGIIVGQPVRVTITVLVPNYFTGSPRFPSFQLDHAIVVLPDEQAAHLSETIGGHSYTGLARTYLVYPQSAGDFRLPQAVVPTPYAASPPTTTVASLTFPALQFTAELPAGARGLPYFLPTNQLTIRQQVSDVTHLKAGDSIERTITVTADRTQPMNLPPTEWRAPSGVRVYPKEPRLTTLGADRTGFLAGVREDRANYLILEAGDFELPAVRVYWWDLRAGKVREAVAPAIRVVAGPNPNFVPDLAPEPEAVPVPRAKPSWGWLTIDRLAWAAALAAALVAFLWIGRRYSPALRRLWSDYAARRKEAEPTYFSRLESALQSDSPSEAYRRLLAWLRKTGQDQDGLSGFLRSVGSAEVNNEVEMLNRHLYSGGPASAWSGKQLRELLPQARKRIASDRAAPPPLPPLNPSRS